MRSYRPRIVDSKLQDKLEETGAVLIEGPKWCGRTTTAEQASSSNIYMNDPFNMDQNISLATIDPSFMTVITGVGHYAYTRPDGIHVIPIGYLRD